MCPAPQNDWVKSVKEERAELAASSFPKCACNRKKGRKRLIMNFHSLREERGAVTTCPGRSRSCFRKKKETQKEGEILLLTLKLHLDQPESTSTHREGHRRPSKFCLMKCLGKHEGMQVMLSSPLLPLSPSPTLDQKPFHSLCTFLLRDM